MCLLLEAIFTPWYLKALWPTKCFKSLCLKMVCSCMFFSIGILSLFIAKNTSAYAVTMMVGLGFGWIGDYFLHAKPTNTYFVIGFTSFMIGHIVYVTAYIRALCTFNGYNMFNLTEIGIGAAILIICFALAFAVLKVKFDPKVMKYASVLYGAILVTMFLKATALGLQVYHSGAENGIFAALTLFFGSLFFLLSDTSLGVILFGGQRKNYPLKIFNIVTYFWGQVLLASSILFVNIG